MKQIIKDITADRSLYKGKFSNKTTSDIPFDNSPQLNPNMLTDNKIPNNKKKFFNFFIQDF